MSSIAKLSGRTVVGFSIAWIVAVILLFVAMTIASARLAIRATDSGGLAAVGFAFGPMTFFILFGPPLGLVVAWLLVRSFGMPDSEGPTPGS